MNKGKVRNGERVQQKKEALNKILWLKTFSLSYVKKLRKKSRKELERILKK